MSDPSIPTLTRRIERLEGRLRRWRLAAGAPLLAVALAVVLGAAPSAEVRTRMLTVVGKDGKPRAHLGEGGDGQVVLALLDGSRRTRAALFVNDEGAAGLSLADVDGKPRVRLDLLDDPKARSGLILLDAGEKARGEMVVLAEGAARIQLSDGAGKALFNAP